MSRHVPSSAVLVLLAATLAACGVEEPRQPAAPSKPAPGDPSPVSRSLNGCDPDSATNRTGMAEVEIRFGEEIGYSYEPNCVRVSAGTRLTFVGHFVAHPLAVGELAAVVTDPDRASPLRDTESGEVATFVMDLPGSYPYLCNLHAWDGMMGAVFVE